jgi:hypothetical protein
MTPLPSGFKTKEEYAKYMRNYRSYLKAKSDLVKRWKKAYIDPFKIKAPPEPTGDLLKDSHNLVEYQKNLNKAFIALRMFLDAEEKTGELTNLDDLDKIFREGLEALQTILKEAQKVADSQ